MIEASAAILALISLAIFAAHAARPKAASRESLRPSDVLRVKSGSLNWIPP
jgi:hypothetical protein